MPIAPGPQPGQPPAQTLPPKPSAAGMPDYWAAFGAYTVLFFLAGGTEEVSRVAVALAWSVALVAGFAWVETLSSEGRAPFGSGSFWRT